MKRDDVVYVKHALEASEKIIKLISDKSRPDLDADEVLSLALIRLLEIIGEAANCLSETYRENNPNIPWKKMIAMRNRLIHGYFDINYDIIWDTVKNDIPKLKNELKKIL